MTAKQKSSIKEVMGRCIRKARDAKGLSRSALGIRLGISAKTIQSWEMGRTFIENLSLLPAIETELGISIGALMDAIVKKETIAAPQSKPSEPVERNIKFVPMIRLTALLTPPAHLKSSDILQQVAIPADWQGRSGVLVAVRLQDSTMAPLVPLGSTAIVDKHCNTPKLATGRLCCLSIHDKGIRLRRLVQDPSTNEFFAETAIEGRRKGIPFEPKNGDQIVGRIVGLIGVPE